MPVRLAGIALAHLTDIATCERAKIARHSVPGLSGDLMRPLGRSSAEVRLAGAFYGAGAADDLERLRQAYQTGQPVDFVVQAVDDSDLVQTLSFSRVLISGLDVAQSAECPGQFDYNCRLVEYVEPPAPVAPDVFGALDAGLVGEATDFIDEAQNALDQVSQLADLIAAVPSFGDPTQRLPRLLAAFTPLASGSVTALTAVRDLFGSEG